MQRFRHLSLALALALADVALAACGDGDGGDAALSPASPVITAISPAASTPVEVSPPNPPAKPPPSEGHVSKACVEGWTTPPQDDRLYDAALRVLRRETGWGKGEFVVFDLRFFEGPESPPAPDKGYLRVVQRWYLKGYMRSDPALQGRFLIERRTFGSGLSALASFDTRGWRSPDWIGFQYDTAAPSKKVYPGLPGEWAGIPYDFVRGGEGLNIPGLPDEVVGCLDGT